MIIENTGKFEFKKIFFGCKFPEKGLETLDYIVRNRLKRSNTQRAFHLSLELQEIDFQTY